MLEVLLFLLTVTSNIKVGKIEIQGTKVLKEDQIRKILQIKEGSIFKEDIFKRDIDEIIKKYENMGYPYCKIEPYNFSLQGGKLNFGIEISEGPLVRIKDILVEGNRVTKDYVIRREFRVKKNSIFRQRKIDEGKKRLESLGFLTVKGVSLKRDKLQVEVEEGFMNEAEGVIGLKQEKILGMLSFKSINLFGTGRGINCRWESLELLSRFIEVGYKEPWLIGLPLNFKFSFAHRMDAQDIRNEFCSVLEAPILFSLSIESGIVLKWLNNKKSESFVIGLNFDNSIPRFLPKKGLHYSLKSYFTQTGLEKTEIHLNNFIPITQNSSLFLSFNGGYIRTDSLIPCEQYRIGGAKTLRGYYEKEFYYTQGIWTNIEYRRFIARESYIFPFLDLAYIDDDFKMGYGVGGAFNSKIGLIGIMYGLPQEASLMEGKIHLFIRTRF